MPRPSHLTPVQDMVRTVYEAGWAPGLLWMVLKILPPPGFVPQTVQPGASHYTDYAILVNLQVYWHL